MLDDTVMAVGTDLYSTALTVYGVLKVAGASEGLDELRHSMSERFNRRRKKAESGEDGSGAGEMPSLAEGPAAVLTP